MIGHERKSEREREKMCPVEGGDANAPNEPKQRRVDSRSEMIPEYWQYMMRLYMTVH